MDVREPQLAGSWYPAEERPCREAIDRFAQQLPAKRLSAEREIGSCCGAVLPHAGWTYSGKIAYHAVDHLATKAQPETVLLFAGHLSPKAPPSVLVDAHYWTPLGLIQADNDLALRIAALPGVVKESALKHSQDNSAEVEFPLIRHCFPNSKLVVIAAPPKKRTIALARQIQAIVTDLNRTVLALGSTDLSHYGPRFGWIPQGTGKQAETWVRETNDRRFIEAVSDHDPTLIIERGFQEQSACCPGAVASAVAFCQASTTLAPQLLDYATSADTNPSDNFVGYAGIVF